MPSSRCRISRFFICLKVSARFLHGFCTVSKRAKGANRCKIGQGVQKLEAQNLRCIAKMMLKRNFQKLRKSPGVRYESVGRGFESLPSHQEKPVHIVCWFFFFFFVCAMEGARTERRRIAPQAISPVGCCLARGFQRVGMSTVEAVNRKISWLFCFVSHGCTVSARFLHGWRFRGNPLHGLELP